MIVNRILFFTLTKENLPQRVSLYKKNTEIKRDLISKFYTWRDVEIT